MLLALLAAPASAADVPSWYFRESVAVALWPTGLLSETRLQVRAPLYRSNSIVFQDTYAGVGMRLDSSPAFVNPGVQISLAPIDIFDVDLSASLLGYFPGPYGLLPYSSLGGKLGDERDARTDHISAFGWSLDAAPELKLKVGPIIGVEGVTLSWIHIAPPAGTTAPFVYEPLRDMIVAWDDVVIDHQPLLLWEAVPGKDETPRFAPGLLWHDRIALGSGDRTASLGLIVVSHPSDRPSVPTIVGIAAAYLIDHDRPAPSPFVALQANWILEPPLRHTAPAAPAAPMPG